jgi:hypothetical protein
MNIRLHLGCSLDLLKVEEIHARNELVDGVMRWPTYVYLHGTTCWALACARDELLANVSRVENPRYPLRLIHTPRASRLAGSVYLPLSLRELLGKPALFITIPQHQPVFHDAALKEWRLLPPAGLECPM